MKSVLILQHMSADSPGYLGTWLRRHDIAFEVRDSQGGDVFPADLGDHDALAVLGGSMSANDALPSLRQAERLILQGFELGKPVIGHCLGGQLMARALGASIGRSPAPEVGWHGIDLLPVPEARDWFGGTSPGEVFQWHYEAFDLPRGAVALASSAACPWQAFGMGPHLAMQFHVELDLAKLSLWCAEDDPDHLAALQQHATVQSCEQMLRGCEPRLAAQQRLADRLYAQWWSGVARS